ncbi:unnamed protein product [Fraxinus pennsylvanica]|uniref:TraB domain-containing protein n=1 Tax=Fraxinus pennsylvanica TaxID=56036 RepID=A0AAD1ZR32_9LAMI|nr:unnamed protein product [Fraxinus pennsylvanica]
MEPTASTAASDHKISSVNALRHLFQYGPVPPWRSEFTESEAAIWLIGTTHISKQSASDLLRVIRALRPDNVVVELCRSRAGIMYTSNNGELNQQLRSNMFSLSGSGLGWLAAVLTWVCVYALLFCSCTAFFRRFKLYFSHITGGQIALALPLLFAAFSSKMSSDIDRPFGDEVDDFHAARKASEEIGAQLVLGDRQIEITESSTGDDNFQPYEQLSSSHPSLLPPLVYELIQ